MTFVERVMDVVKRRREARLMAALHDSELIGYPEIARLFGATESEVQKHIEQYNEQEALKEQIRKKIEGLSTEEES